MTPNGKAVVAQALDFQLTSPFSFSAQLLSSNSNASQIQRELAKLEAEIEKKEKALKRVRPQYDEVGHQEE